MTTEALLAQVVQALDLVGVPYMVTGSLATLHYGRPRLTNDLDLVVALAPEQVEPLAQQFPEPAYYFDQAMAQEAIAHQSQFNILHPESGLKVDLVICRARAFSQTELSRRRREPLGEGLQVMMASPEDVILAKLEAYAEGRSEKHLRDIAGVLQTVPRLDRAYLDEWAARLGLTALWDQVQAG